MKFCRYIQTTICQINISNNIKFNVLFTLTNHDEIQLPLVLFMMSLLFTFYSVNSEEYDVKNWVKFGKMLNCIAHYC